MIATGFRGPWLLSKHTSERMESGSNIVNIGSVHEVRIQSRLFPYNAAKVELNATRG